MNRWDWAEMMPDAGSGIPLRAGFKELLAAWWGYTFRQ